MKISLNKSLISVAVAQVITAQAATAATITVNDGGDVSQDDMACTLREAIDSANDNPMVTSSGCVAGEAGLDTIVFDPSITGVISLTQGTRIDLEETITITGPGEDQLTIDASNNGSNRVFVAFGGGASVFTISDITLSGGSVGGNGGGIYVRQYTELNLSDVTIMDSSASNVGGGLFVGENATAILTNCTLSKNVNGARGGGIGAGGDSKIELIDTVLTENTASFVGGAIYANNNSEVTITRGEISKNLASIQDGGGIFARRNSSVTLVNTTLSSNTASDDGGGVALRDYAFVSSSGTTWDNNYAQYGGAIAFSNTDDVTLVVNDDTFYKNTALTQGGAIRLRGVGDVTVNNSAFYNNEAGTGGGALTVFSPTTVKLDKVAIFNNTAILFGGGISTRSELSLTNSTVSGNSVTGGSGGGIHTGGYSSLTVINSTITGNSVSGAAGGLSISGDTNPETIINTIVSGNISINSGSEIRVYAGRTLVADASNVLGSSAIDSAQAFSGFTPGASDIDATSDTLGSPFALGSIIEDLADNGGPTLTHALPAKSPAINAGNQALCTASGVLTDQRSVDRDNRCDIGAFEFPESGSFFVIPHENGVTIFEL